MDERVGRGNNEQCNQDESENITTRTEGTRQVTTTLLIAHLKMSEQDVCQKKFLFVQAGGLRAGKTSFGFSAGRNFAANLD
jgi:hypothetical protein